MGLEIHAHFKSFVAMRLNEMHARVYILYPSLRIGMTLQSRGKHSVAQLK